MSHLGTSSTCKFPQQGPSHCTCLARGQSVHESTEPTLYTIPHALSSRQLFKMQSLIHIQLQCTSAQSRHTGILSLQGVLKSTRKRNKLRCSHQHSNKHHLMPHSPCLPPCMKRGQISVYKFLGFPSSDASSEHHSDVLFQITKFICVIFCLVTQQQAPSWCGSEWTLSKSCQGGHITQLSFPSFAMKSLYAVVKVLQATRNSLALMSLLLDRIKQTATTKKHHQKNMYGVKVRKTPAREKAGSFGVFFTEYEHSTTITLLSPTGLITPATTWHELGTADNSFEVEVFRMTY